MLILGIGSETRRVPDYYAHIHGRQSRRSIISEAEHERSRIEETSDIKIFTFIVSLLQRAETTAAVAILFVG